MSSRQSRPWLCLPPVGLCLVDVALTLNGQPPEYWAGAYRLGREGNPIAEWFMFRGPWAFAGLTVGWLLVMSGMALFFPRRLAVAASFIIGIAHTLAGCTWMLGLGWRGWVGIGLYLLLAERLLTVAWVNSGGKQRALAKSAKDAEKKEQGWRGRVRVGLVGLAGGVLGLIVFMSLALDPWPVHSLRLTETNGWDVTADGRYVVAATGMTSIDFIDDESGMVFRTAHTVGPVRVYDMFTGEQVASVVHSGEPIEHWRVLPDGRHLVVAMTDGRLRVFGLPTGALRHDLETSRTHATDHEFYPRFWSSPDSKRLAFERADGQAACILDLHTGEMMGEVPGARRPYGFSGDDRLLATATAGRDVLVWDIETRRLRHTFAGHQVRPHTLAFAAEAPRLATGFTRLGEPLPQPPQEVLVWNLETGREEARIVVSPENNSSQVLLSADGGLVLLPTYRHTQLFDLRHAPPLDRQDLLFGTGDPRRPGRFDSASFAPDGRRLVVTDSVARTVTVIECDSRKVLSKLHVAGDNQLLLPAYILGSGDLLTANVIRMRFRPESLWQRWKVTLADPDSYCLLFDPDTGAELGRLRRSVTRVIPGSGNEHRSTLVTVHHERFGDSVVIQHVALPLERPWGRILFWSAVPGLLLAGFLWWRLGR